MTKLDPGDKIDCRIKFGIIVSPYKEYDDIITLEIVACDKYGYYAYVPYYMCLKETYKVDKHSAKVLGIHSKFLEENIIYIRESSILRVVSKLDGLICDKCKEFYGMAEPNQENGLFICWSCRNYPPYR